ncbi:DNA polymerase I [Parasulfuritortus cantonensis]|uniref:DNA polymerase I n=1 Tax=Parasulfuritortus cantonensis TaxID=2528202 RepID=A0A4V2NW88_9PROT|nr:DNA polymerase I [Parasulfuritortus cantonensis]TCJ16312.1 DNA polymerase I [Parasulfuritortus cantonensis]
MDHTLLLVDGSSYLYRAFHALPDLRNRDGFPTGALYGVINMLRRLHKENPAAFVACVFDAKGKTFRDDLYPEYKAHRPPMPEDLARQIEPIHEAVRALGWPILMIEGVEADDVIATLVRRAEAEGLASIVSTGDKDLAQLVTPRVRLVNTMTNETLDEAGVQAKFGVPPARIVDYLSLVGDAVDNVPGVDKVGPKTAAKWIAEYGGLDELMARAGEVKGKAGENLRQALDWLPTARTLVTVKDDVALPVALDQLHWQPEDRDKLFELFERFNFRTWLRELQAPGAAAPASAPAEGGAVAPPRARVERRYETLLGAADLERWLDKLAGAELICLDTETTSLDPMQARLVGMSFSVVPARAHPQAELGFDAPVAEAAYLPLAHAYAGAPDQLDLAATLAHLKPILEDPDRAKVGQNLKYDWHVLKNHGVDLQGIVHDTLLQSYVLEAHERHDMDTLAERHLGETTIKYEEVCGKGAGQIGFDQVDVERATAYAAEDADITLRLHQAMYPRVRAEAGLDHVYRHIEMPLLPILARIERTGVKLDCELLRRHSDFLAREMLEIEQKAHAAAGQPFNLNSTKQLGEIFFNQLKLPVLKKTPKGAPSTDEEVLEKLAEDYPLPKLILDYRGLAKLKSTYTDKLPLMVNPATGRVHTTYSQAVAVTGRLASNDPNLQNIPVRTQEGRKIREAFVAEPGCVIVSADYSQIELRIMAHLSGDERLLAAFAEDADIHRATAAEVLGLAPEQVLPEQRRMAKAVNFGLIYGMSAFGLAAQLNIDRTTAQAYIDRYFARYPGVAEYMARTREQAKMEGYVETLFGRRLYLPEIRSGNPQRRQGAERAAINAPMQGTAADLIKLAMIAVQGWLDAECLQTRLIMQVHDELVLEVAEAELDRVRTRLPELMGGVADLKVPLKVEAGVGPNWEAAH